MDDVLSTADRVAAEMELGDGIVFIPAARRDTVLLDPERFAGVKDIALAESPGVSGTLKGVAAPPGAIREAMLTVHRIVLVTDAARTFGGSGAAQDRAKEQMLTGHFTLSGDSVVRARRVLVYERAPVPPLRHDRRTGHG